MTQKNRAAHPVFILKSFFYPPVSVPNNVYGFGIRQFFAVAAHCHQQKAQSGAVRRNADNTFRLLQQIGQSLLHPPLNGCFALPARKSLCHRQTRLVPAVNNLRPPAFHFLFGQPFRRTEIAFQQAFVTDNRNTEPYGRNLCRLPCPPQRRSV